MSQYKLAQEIIALSESAIWDKAKLEWELDQVYQEEEPDTCLCGHYPILEICILKNRFNQNSAVVGNCCVKKFIGLPSDKIFQAIKRVRKDETKSLNAEALAHALRNRWINEWEYNFYLSIAKKRDLSSKQEQKKLQVNQKVLQRMVNAKPKS